MAAKIWALAYTDVEMISSFYQPYGRPEFNKTSDDTTHN